MKYEIENIFDLISIKLRHYEPTTFICMYIHMYTLYFKASQLQYSPREVLYKSPRDHRSRPVNPYLKPERYKEMRSQKGVMHNHSYYVYLGIFMFNFITLRTIQYCHIYIRSYCLLALNY